MKKSKIKEQLTNSSNRLPEYFQSTISAIVLIINLVAFSANAQWNNFQNFTIPNYDPEIITVQQGIFDYVANEQAIYGTYSSSPLVDSLEYGYNALNQLGQQFAKGLLLYEEGDIESIEGNNPGCGERFIESGRVDAWLDLGDDYFT